MNPLALPQPEYKAVFERITQVALEYLASIDERPSFPAVSGSNTEALFSKPLSENGIGIAALNELSAVIDGLRPGGPRFFGYVMGSGEPVAAAADLLASVLNQNVTAWRSGPSAATLERVVVGWLAEAIGCKGFRGSLTGGGSPANLMGLAMAREACLPANETGARPGTIYASEQIHMSVPKAVALLGIGRDHLRLIACDEEFRIRTDLLRKAIRRDLRAGLTPIAVVGSAGTVSTGSIDPLHELAVIAREFGVWFHVDGAYGALAAIAEPRKFAGLSEADSLSLDPHKWLYQPLDCGCLLYRDAAAARRAFSHTGDYAKALLDDPIEGFAFFEESIELSRRFRALKLWLSLRYHGLASFREAIRNDLAMAQHLAALIAKQHELELLAPIPLSALCFRYRVERDSDSLNQKILQAVIRRGRVFLSNASIHGRFALRACIVNHRTTTADVEQVVSEVIAVGRELTPGSES
ncbi:MAG TPA: pyridoxal-dependent decarboxylase [Terriglobales bacterium]|nr:pyridoxal-dependent decarboxylase [Terriglobales bacterium]